MDSIGDFAENLINEQLGGIKSGKQLPPSLGGGPTPNSKDIRNIEVPDSFMKEVLGEAFHPQDTPATDKGIPELVWTEPEAVEEPKAPESLTEETAQQLVPLLEEVRDLLKEMGTTAGMMGVNLAGPGKDQESYAKMEKKYGYISSKPSKLPGDSRKSILKQSIRNKLNKK
tara:strand:+ start:343 stop:855 length:513 start_codon:yes stop_codon:yes gene_type:complete